MKAKCYLSIITAALAYIITVILTLISYMPLLEVLKNGIFAFIFTGLLTLFILLIIEYYSDEDEKEIQGRKDTERQGGGSGYNDKDEGDLFKPLNPKVMKVESEGEDN